MKNLVMIAIAFATLSVAAQEQKTEASMKNKMEMRKDMSAEDMAQIQTKKMTLNLDLTAAQQTEVEKVLLAQAKENETKKAAYKAKKESGTEPTSEDRVKMENERLDQQIALKKKMKGILNADQYTKFEENMNSKRGHGKGKKMGAKPHKK